MSKNGTSKLPVATAYPRLQQKPHESCGLGLLNQVVWQLIGVVPGTGRADLCEQDTAVQNRFADRVSRLSGADAV